MIEIETTCRQCRETFTPDHADYVRGLWRVCPRCRDGPESTGATGHDDPNQTLSGQINASENTDRKGNNP